jgi:hypothetical protein
VAQWSLPRSLLAFPVHVRVLAADPLEIDMTMQTTNEKRALLGKQVRVTIDRPIHDPAHIVEGKLLGFGDDGTFEVMQDDGFVHYCWPMLDIEEVTGAKGE